ncbi:winged helix-turn-helix domain-containing protein [Micromonospora sp. NPDC051543]|uniref:winged helix-turn-helix domain-containing protein n=1 Tax=Micromonospora sp. NPDC051543 TaxID=3364287 RepID=UPI0037AF878B
MLVPTPSPVLPVHRFWNIANGEYAPGERLPTYNELSALYDVSVTTVQRAVIVLQTRGLVVGLQGRGLWVAEKPPT